MLLRMDNSEKALQTHPVQLLILVQHPVDSPSHRNQSKLFEQTQQVRHVVKVGASSWPLLSALQCPVPVSPLTTDQYEYWVTLQPRPWCLIQSGGDTSWGDPQLWSISLPKATLGKKLHKLLITFQQESPLMFLCWAAAAFTLRCLFHSSDENDASYNKLYK